MLRHLLMTLCNLTLADMLVEDTSQCRLLEAESLMMFNVSFWSKTLSRRK